MSKATSPIYRVPFRRRRKFRTNYKGRYSMLKSRKPRLVVRKKNKNLIVHVVVYSPEGDRTVFSVGKKDLEKMGWNVKSNLPTAYLYGLMVGKIAKKHNIEEAILDIGIHTPTKNGTVFAVAKGSIDSGLKINLGMELDESRLKGEHIAKHAKLLKEKDNESYNKQYSSYIKQKIDPENLPKLFEETKNKILRGE